MCLRAAAPPLRAWGGAAILFHYNAAKADRWKDKLALPIVAIKPRAHPRICPPRWAVESKKYYGESCNARGVCNFLLEGGPLNDHKTVSADLTDGSLFGSESHPPDKFLAHSFLKGDSSANGLRGAREGELSDNPDGKGSVSLTDDNSSALVLSPPRMSGIGQGKDKGDKGNKTIHSPLAYCHGGSKKILHSMLWHKEEEQILRGIWPGVSDTSLLTRFISCHFEGNPEAYVSFSW